MKLRLLVALFLLTLVPLGALATLGARLARREADRAAHERDQAVRSKLADWTAAVARHVDERGRELRRFADDLPGDALAIRERLRRDARVMHALVFDREARLVFPPPSGPLSQAERRFLERTRGLWEGRSFAWLTTAEGAPALSDEDGWRVAYWGEGLNLLYWRRTPARMVVLELGRVQILSELCSLLPVTTDGGPPERVALMDAGGRVLYQWGAYAPGAGEAPRATCDLAEPLREWKLAYFSPAAAAGAGVRWSLVAGLSAVGLALVGLATYFYRESTREIRRAAQRVSFVNHVSHELKTPLTNIRMYAELLDDALEDADEGARRHLRVIVTESQRLSRLIGNILTFARGQRGRLALRPAPGCVDEVVRETLAQFEPAFRQHGIAARFEAGAPGVVTLDRDAVGQILGNLLGNVEKYAASGGEVRVRTSQDARSSTIAVTDRGPGIGPVDRERIFEPFERLSHAAADGVAGTGIGLTIARDLARLHGGDVRLVPSEAGASFEVTLATEAAG